MLSCSLDGDADRIVFHQRLGLKRGQDLGQGVNQDLGQALDQDPSQSLNQDPSLNPDGAGWSLMDGDKIAALAAGFVKEQLAIVNGGLSFAAVQTAYANGAATAHMRAEGVPVVIVSDARASFS
jgi:phosphomannomutase